MKRVDGESGNGFLDAVRLGVSERLLKELASKNVDPASYFLLIYSEHNTNIISEYTLESL